MSPSAPGLEGGFSLEIQDQQLVWAMPLCGGEFQEGRQTLALCFKEDGPTPGANPLILTVHMFVVFLSVHYSCGY